jgi:hypothetical protein
LRRGDSLAPASAGELRPCRWAEFGQMTHQPGAVDSTRRNDPSPGEPRLALVTEAFLDRSLPELLDWRAQAAPAVTGLELGCGGFAPHPHLDRELLLADAGARMRWAADVSSRGFAVVALNAWSNPLHPDRQIGTLHDSELRDTIRPRGGARRGSRRRARRQSLGGERRLRAAFRRKRSAAYVIRSPVGKVAIGTSRC